MSYNISSMKIKRVDLRMPKTFAFMKWVESLPVTDDHGYERSGRRWLLGDPSYIVLDPERATWFWEFGDQELRGTVDGDTLVLGVLNCTGEGSGTLWTDILLPLFSEHKGNLSALVVWEGGDTVERVTITDGEIETEEIE